MGVITGMSNELLMEMVQKIVSKIFLVRKLLQSCFEITKYIVLGLFRSRFQSYDVILFFDSWGSLRHFVISLLGVLYDRFRSYDVILFFNSWGSLRRFVISLLEVVTTCFWSYDIILFLSFFHSEDGCRNYCWWVQSRERQMNYVFELLRLS